MKLEWLDEPSHPTDDPAAALAQVGVQLKTVDPATTEGQDTLRRLRADHGYLHEDQVELQPQTPYLDEICAKFAVEHRHLDDEVRHVLDGEGVFDIRSADDRWIRITMQTNDLIVVPADLYHRFFLTDVKSIRCARLFVDASGWEPHYRIFDPKPSA